MRAVAIGARERVEYRELAGRITLAEESERGMQPEEAVERQRAALLCGSAQREIPAQSRVIAIAVRRHSREPVESAPQNDDDEPRLALLRTSEHDARSQEGSAGGEGCQVEEFPSLHP